MKFFSKKINMYMRKKRVMKKENREVREVVVIQLK